MCEYEEMLAVIAKKRWAEAVETDAPLRTIYKRERTYVKHAHACLVLLKAYVAVEEMQIESAAE